MLHAVGAVRYRAPYNTLGQRKIQKREVRMSINSLDERSRKHEIIELVKEL